MGAVLDRLRSLSTWKLPVASDAVIEERIAICESCEFYIKSTTNCKKCACFMKLKTKFEGMSCPIEKW
tara:strand:- start:3426 stop:3629 length:204 start_codon:yes stop_codon:yes gene_type:complete